jgi:methionyl aminopeptidase
MTIGSEQDLAALKRIGRIVALTRDEMVRAVRPGISTLQLDKVGETVLLSHGANSAPRHEYDFPGSTCISVNDEVAHGIPGGRVLKTGDLVNIDVSAELDGYFADTGATVVIGDPSDLKSRLCECSRNALKQGMAKARAGSKLNQIGRAIENEAKANGFVVIRNLTGHGIGRRLHEAPDCIPNYFEKRDNRLIKSGMVLAIETFISSGAEYTIEDSDGWTLRTPDRSLILERQVQVIVDLNDVGAAGGAGQAQRRPIYGRLRRCTGITIDI